MVVTAYMEDTPNVGIWTYRLKGFADQPTDHYMRTFFVEAENDIRKHKPYCIGSLPKHKASASIMFCNNLKKAPNYSKIGFK